ncbi:hypothetical protein BN12_220011 [Nostocoides japonicum T1-X7]|uniref:Uncharacterized protein n=1 Tax=Nostocoides japonicum T1-X7 TaxID=1194083 RepID=A0A077LUZ3_9MICO|nr:hypothetical protein [Tetrasphaera japonica]CCH77733.1 hypothetical protein BN12_220011 [Tetrasphaera japonica T1-X7]
MSAQLYVYEMPGRTVLLRSSVWTETRDWLKARRVPAQWSPGDRGWHLRRDRLGEVLLMAEAEGIRVQPKGLLR